MKFARTFKRTVNAQQQRGTRAVFFFVASRWSAKGARWNLKLSLPASFYHTATKERMFVKETFASAHPVTNRIIKCPPSFFFMQKIHSLGPRKFNNLSRKTRQPTPLINTDAGENYALVAPEQSRRTFHYKNRFMCREDAFVIAIGAPPKSPLLPPLFSINPFGERSPHWFVARTKKKGAIVATNEPASVPIITITRRYYISKSSRAGETFCIVYLQLVILGWQRELLSSAIIELHSFVH